MGARGGNAHDMMQSRQPQYRHTLNLLETWQNVQRLLNFLYTIWGHVKLCYIYLWRQCFVEDRWRSLSMLSLRETPITAKSAVMGFEFLRTADGSERLGDREVPFGPLIGRCRSCH